MLAIVVLLGTRPGSGIPYTLLIALASSVVNWLVLEPAITKGALERYALEDAGVEAERREAVVKRTSKYHAMSSGMALVTLCCAVAHGYFLTSLLSF